MLIYPGRQIPYFVDSIKISHNLNYPLWHLEDVLLPLFQRNYTNDSLRETIHSANHIWCAYQNSKCVGCVLLTDIGSNGGLYMMLFGIRRSAQGRGIGTKLLETIVGWAYKRRYKFINLHTEFNNRKAIRMYEKAGFRRGIYQTDYIEQLPQSGFDAVSMTLFLI